MTHFHSGSGTNESSVDFNLTSSPFGTLIDLSMKRANSHPPGIFARLSKVFFPEKGIP
jgi:hypothetical protein